MSPRGPRVAFSAATAALGAPGRVGTGGTSMSMLPACGAGRSSAGRRSGLRGRAQHRRKHIHLIERNLGDFRAGKLLFQRVAKRADVANQHDIQIASREIFSRRGLHLFQ